MGEEREIDRLGRPFIEQRDANPAAGPWRTDEPPKDGRTFLGQWDDFIISATFDKESFAYETSCGWAFNREPRRWAELNLASGGDD